MVRPRDYPLSEWLPAREGQLSRRTSWETPSRPRHMELAPCYRDARVFRPYRWRERPRHPVLSPAAAQAFAEAFAYTLQP